MVELSAKRALGRRVVGKRPRARPGEFKNNGSAWEDYGGARISKHAAVTVLHIYIYTPRHAHVALSGASLAN